MEAIEILKEYSEYFRQMSIIWLVLYPLLWSVLIDGFYDIAVRMENILDAILSFGGVMQSEGMQTLYSYLTPVAFAFLAIAIIGVAFQLITGKAVQKTNVLLNMILAVAVITLLPWFVMKLGELSDDIIELSKSSGSGEEMEVSSLSTQIVQTNVRDLVYLARNDFQESESDINNTITEDNIRNIDFTEIVHPEPDNDNGERDYGASNSGNSINDHEVFASKIVDNESGGETTEEIEPFELRIIGEIPFLNEYYYRYTGNFINMFAQLGILVAVMLFTSFKIIRLFFEVAFANIIAPFVATTDLSTGQRTKQLLKDLVINYAVIGLVMLVFKIYMVMMNYISTLELNAIVVTVIMFALGLAMIDGPDQAKKLLGIDIGVKDGYRQLMAGLAVGSVATKATGGLRKHVGNEKDKFLQQHQENKEAKEKASSSLAGGNHSDAYSIEGDLNNALNNSGYTNSKDEQDNANFDKTSKAMSEENQISSNGASDAINQNEDESRNVLENIIKDNNDTVNDEEKQVLEKLMNDTAASPNSEERQVLENVMQNEALGSQERQAVESLLASGEGNSQSERQVLENLIAGENGTLTNEEKQVLETLMNDPSAVSSSERQVLENVMQNEALGSQERQAVESLLASGEGNSQSERQVLENLIAGENGTLTNEEKQVLETLMNDPSAVSSSERQVLENVMQNEALGSQERQAVETLISGAQDTGYQTSRNVLENTISPNEGAISQSERQVLERFVESPTSLSPVERSVVENIASVGSLEPQHRQVLEQTLSDNPVSEASSRQIVQSLSTEGSMTAPEIQQSVVRMMNDGGIKSSEANEVINTLHNPSSTASPQQREIVENVISNNPDLSPRDRQVLENVMTQSSNIGNNERTVLEKVMQAPNEISQLERDVLENVIHSDNNLTAKERTSIENIVSNHVGTRANTDNLTQTIAGGNQSSSSETKTEDIVRNMTTNFKADTSNLDNVKRRYNELNKIKNEK